VQYFLLLFPTIILTIILTIISYYYSYYYSSYYFLLLFFTIIAHQVQDVVRMKVHHGSRHLIGRQSNCPQVDEPAAQAIPATAAAEDALLNPLLHSTHMTPPISSMKGTRFLPAWDGTNSPHMRMQEHMRMQKQLQE
jgi:hypothetical protein